MLCNKKFWFVMIYIPFFFRLNVKSSFNNSCPLKTTNMKSEWFGAVLE